MRIDSIFVWSLCGASLVTLRPANADEPLFSTEHWCSDQITYCFANREHKSTFAGIRLLADLSPSLVFDLRNPLASASDSASISASVGLETNLFAGLLGIDLLYIKTASVKYPLDTKYLIAQQPTDGKYNVSVDFGIAISATALEGAIGAGIGYLWLNREAFVSPPGYPADPFFFVSVQPVALARWFKRPNVPPPPKLLKQGDDELRDNGSTPDSQPKPEQPKPEQPKPEQPKPEQPKPEQPKPEQPKPEQPKPEAAPQPLVPR